MTKPSGTYACASVNYFAKNLGEISIVNGDIIEILAEVDDFWFNGQTLHNGLEGRFPKDFVRPLTLPEVNGFNEKLLFALDSFCSEEKDDLNFKRGDVVVLERSIDDSWGWGRCNGRSGMFPFNYTKELPSSSNITTTTQPLSSNTATTTSYVKVLYAFSSQLAGELSLQQGEVVAITSRLADGWACGSVGERSGEFPLAFTQELDKEAIIEGNQTNEELNKAPSKSANGNYLAVDKEASLKQQQCCSESGEAAPLVRNVENDDDALEEQSSHNGLVELTPTKQIVIDGSSSSSQADATTTPLCTTTTTGSHESILVVDDQSFTSLTTELVSTATTTTTQETTAATTTTTKNHLSASEITEFEGSVDIKRRPMMMHNSPAKVRSAAYIQRRTNAVDHMLESANSFDHDPVPTTMIEVSEKWYVALRDVTAVTDFDLTVRTHERIQIVKRINSTWCEARNSHGRTGFVPLDCIVVTKTTTQSGLCRQVSSPSVPTTTVVANPNKQLVRSSTDTDLNRPTTKHFHRGGSDTTGRRRRKKMVGSKSISSSSTTSSSDHSRLSNPPPTTATLSTASSGRRANNDDEMMDLLPPKFPERTTSLRLPRSRKKHRDVMADDVTVSTVSSSEVTSSTDGSQQQHHHRGGSIKRTNSIPPKRPPQPTAFGRRSLRRQSSSRHSHKKKIEKVRVRIEEVTREEKTLKKLIDRATEGKEQQDLTQRRQFANIKLRRLQKELHNLIEGAEDVYECIDDYLVMNDIPESTSSSASAVGTSPVVSSAEQHPYVPDPTAEPKENSRRVKRNQVINELIVTEKAFLSDVRIIVEDILHPILQKEFSGDVPVDKIFGNIEEVHGFTQLLSSELDELIDDDDDEAATEFTIKEQDNYNVGTVFLRHVEQMEEIYKCYCRNYDDSIVIIERLKEEGNEFDTVTNELLENIRRKVSVFTLDSFLIKPIQRVLKYPLLFDQILKNSHMEDGQLCYDIARAAKKIEDVANAINEDRRRKELVRHYKSQNMDVKISEKLRKLNFGSVMKKSSRISQYIRNATGFTPETTEDERFNQVESRFKRVEKVVKMFQTNMDDLLCRQRDFLHSQAQVASELLKFHMADTNDSIKSYSSSMCRIAEQSFRQFHDKVQMQAISPLSTLTERYRSPHALIDKRFDKLLDYESSLRSSQHTNQVQMAHNVYEALNKQLCDELPKLCDLSVTLLARCVDIFNKLHAQFVRNIIKELEPFFKTFEKHPLSYDQHSSDTYKIMQAYREQSAMIETEMAKFTFMPKTFQIESPMSQRRKSSSYQQSIHQQNRQTIQMKEQLMSKYKLSNSYVAHRNYTSANINHISCVPGDILGVIKKQDPNGNSQIWFVDNGFRQGFISCEVLREFNPVYDFQAPAQQHSPSFYGSLRRDSFGNSPKKSTTKGDSQPTSPISSPARTRANTAQSNTSGHGQANVGTYGQVGQSNTPTHGQQGNVGGYGQVSQSNTPTHGQQANVGTYGQVGQSNTPTHGQQANVGTYGQVGQSNTSGHGQQANVGTYGQVGLGSPVQGRASVPVSPLKTNEAPKQQHPKHYRVEFSFVGRANLELTVNEGEIVILLNDRDKEGNTDWMLVGNAAGQRGYVPSNYITTVDYL